MSENTKTETLGFQTEIKQLLQLVTHSLYSNKEVFLRELISNSSDAADKLRFEALSNSDLYENDGDLKIWIDFDPENKTITVRDNGIGMSREEVITNLGTIAKSGTKEFLAALTQDQTKDAHLIGQFGVGFYSSFVVAEKVSVKTRRAGLTKTEGVVLESSGEGEFSIADIEKEDRGTEVILYLKPDDVEFLDYWRLKQIITKYSDHIVLPIIMKKPLAEGEKVQEEETVNKATALWVSHKKDVKDEEYESLYQHISHDFEKPLTWAHNHVEGKLEYITLLYIPSHPPFDFWTREKRRGLKLYVQRVFIMDDAEQLLPNYLRFVSGVVDAKDLPLNISREMLQNNVIIDKIRSSIIKRVLDMLEKLVKDEPEKYKKFWNSFGGALKEGVVEDFNYRDRIAKLFRFATTKTESEEQTVTLDEYIDRISKDQDKIYYITAESFEAAKNSPYLEVFKRNDIEVLLLNDRIDEWWVAHYKEYQGKKFQAITKGDVEVDKLIKDPKEKTDKEQLKTDYDEILSKIKKVLGDKVKDVRLSSRLTDSPVCIVTTEDDLSFNMQRIMESYGQQTPEAKPILELNPKHGLVKRLKDIDDDELFTEWSNLFLDQAILIAGGKLKDVAGFAGRLNNLLLR